MPPNLLLVAEHGAGTRVGRVLSEAGHQVEVRHTRAAACSALEETAVDLTLVDPRHSEVDSVDAVRAIRTRTPAPIVLIDPGPPANLDAFLAAGADDFLSVPFSAVQLRNRVNVALATRHARPEQLLGVGGLTLDKAQRLAWLDGKPLGLSRREFDLLACLATRAGEVVLRAELAVAVWPESTADLDRTINVHLSWLRRKLGDTAGRPRYLHTVRGVGLRLGFESGTALT
ncbi:response regulator transcription factor [Catelliglobosispora koreensis]|uniref:response regulator transcription factor n=1 Tax=Catelliglobosispora koreensis TaxID=129052 RepID=UPI0003740E63|nr:response regulator transcription factor [Catelliglobosispora koreensis]